LNNTFPEAEFDDNVMRRILIGNIEQKITPYLWFNTEARNAAQFYISIFNDSKVISTTTLHNTPSGDTDILSFQLAGQSFMAISGGPYFRINPSVSFFVNFDPSKDKDARLSMDLLWEKLIEGGTILMPLQEYPFSKHYGWVQDKYGVSWQLILSNPEGKERPVIMPSLMFVGTVCGRAEEAMNFYRSVFKNSEPGNVARYGSGQEPDKEGTIMFADFALENQWLAVMDSAYDHNFAFNEAISFVVTCTNQEEIDYYWEELSAVPEAEQCGWLKDKFGISWQITPEILSGMLQDSDLKKVERVTRAFLQMKKFNIEKLKEAYQG
jgi:predicted 3-demethylubiquinone-9 3-methyltransferase (glyoxalase superfamily)